MDPFFAWIEHWSLGIWIRESLSIFAFPGILTAHTLGLAVLAGTHAAIDLRVLGVAPRLPIAPLARYLPLAWVGFWVSVATGVALVVAYPAKALTNPLFFVKLALVGLAVVVGIRMHRLLRSDEVERGATTRAARALAASSLLLWTGAIVSGRLLAYTYTRLLTGL